MSNIAIITARSGSKRIPLKNVKKFCGKPIIAYSIEAALSSGVFDEVMVSTDSEKFAEIAQNYGAVVPFLRSEKTSNDFATTADVLLEVLDRYKQKGKNFDIFCCIYPTAPFVTSEKLKHAMDILVSSHADSLMPVVQYSFPPQRGVVVRNGKLGYLHPEFRTARSQDLEPVYHDCGQFYLCRTKAFYQYREVITPNTVPMMMREEEVQDIDNLSDWCIAETKYRTFVLGKAEENVRDI